MTLYEKKILQIRTANFANSEINSQVPPVSLKAELTVVTWAIRTVAWAIRTLSWAIRMMTWAIRVVT